MNAVHRNNSSLLWESNDKRQQDTRKNAEVLVLKLMVSIVTTGLLKD